MKKLLSELADFTEKYRKHITYSLFFFSLVLVYQIYQSIKRFGFTQPIMMNENTGKLLAGHGRLQTLQTMKQSGEKVPNFAKRNYSSYLPDVYTGHPNRIQRYFQYDQMDSDSEINAALDILAEFSTLQNKENETPFDIVFKDETTEHEVKLLKKRYYI